MNSNFCETAIFQQMYNELLYIVKLKKMPAYVDYYCNSANIIFSPNVELTTGIIVTFTNISMKYKCDLKISNSIGYLVFTFNYRI